MLTLPPVGHDGQSEFRVNGVPFWKAKPYRARLGETQLWVIKNDTQWDHPFHLHGYFFHAARRQERAGAAAGVEGHGEHADEARPPACWWRSTSVPATWMFHCHILDHAEGGLMGTVHVGPGRAGGSRPLALRLGRPLTITAAGAAVFSGLVLGGFGALGCWSRRTSPANPYFLLASWLPPITLFPAAALAAALDSDMPRGVRGQLSVLWPTYAGLVLYAAVSGYRWIDASSRGTRGAFRRALPDCGHGGARRRIPHRRRTLRAFSQNPPRGIPDVARLLHTAGVMDRRQHADLIVRVALVLCSGLLLSVPAAAETDCAAIARLKGTVTRMTSTTYVTRDADGRLISEAVHYGPELWQRDSTTYTYFADRVEAEIDAVTTRRNLY